MGHSLDVHHIHYRPTLDVIERIDITKILLMMDYGQVGKFKGKKLRGAQTWRQLKCFLVGVAGMRLIYLIDVYPYEGVDLAEGMDYLASLLSELNEQNKVVKLASSFLARTRSPLWRWCK